jgi:nicotinate-nucleotide adenylyltransferase
MSLVGILGGTFDPPHNGHLQLARAAMRTGSLAKILLIPNNVPPHKQSLTPAAHRLEMLKIFARQEQWLHICEIELRREGKSYMIDTVKELQRANPGECYRLIIGADTALDFGSWKDAETLLRLAPPLVAVRPGSSMSADFVKDGPAEISEHGRRILHNGRIEMPETDISSTEIRRLIVTHEDAREFMDDAVYRYAIENHLYR